MANISVSDVAAVVETIVVTEVYVKSTQFTLTAHTGLTSSLASTVSVGKPIQGNMRQLALARWNYMYPS